MNGKVKWICSRFELGAELSCLAPDLCCNYAPAFSLKECKCCQRGYTEGLWSELTFPAFFPMTHPSSSSPSANPDHSPAPPPHMGLCLFAVVPYISQYPQPVSWDTGTGFVLFPSYIVIYQGPLPSSGEKEWYSQQFLSLLLLLYVLFQPVLVTRTVMVHWHKLQVLSVRELLQV